MLRTGVDEEFYRLRLAVRNRADNDALIAALVEELGENS